MKQLPEPNFIDRDPSEITQAHIDTWQSLTGKTLYPGQPERLWTNVSSYRETLLRIAIQEAAKQNLARYASYPILDFIGEPLGVVRLDAAYATVTLQFSLNLPPVQTLDNYGNVVSTAAGTLPYDVFIPAGTQVRTGDGLIIFATLSEVLLKAGQTSITVQAQATTPGEAGNGYQAGDLTTMLSPIDSLSVASLDVSAGGADVESDERLRERVIDSPEKFAAAGPQGAYRYYAMSAHTSIIDAAPVLLAPGLIAVYCLTASGALPDEVASLVVATLSAQLVRPMSDQVLARAALACDYQIEMAISVYSSCTPSDVLTAVNAALSAYAANLQQRLGQDVVPSQIIATAQAVPGVQQVALISPASYLSLASPQYPLCTAISVELTGVCDG